MHCVFEKSTTFHIAPVYSAEIEYQKGNPVSLIYKGKKVKRISVYSHYKHIANKKQNYGKYYQTILGKNSWWLCNIGRSAHGELCKWDYVNVLTHWATEIKLENTSILSLFS